jgi:hypothetical protein
MIEVCSATVEDEPSEPVRISVRPLNRDVTVESEPDKDLKSEVCLVKLADEPTLPVRNSAAPLNRVVPMPSEPVRDLPIPLVWEPAVESELVRDLAKPLV